MAALKDLEAGMTTREVAEKYGTTHGTISKWKQKYGTKTQKMTTKEVAESLSCTVKTVLENAKKCLPNKVFDNGKPTEWSEAEVTVLLDYMKEHSNRPDLPLQPVVKATETSLTPDLVIFKAEQEIATLHEKVVAACK